MERYKAILIAVGSVLVLALAIVFGLTRLVHMKPHLSPQEQQLVQYEYQKVELKERKVDVVQGLRNPMSLMAGPASTGADGYPSESLADLAPQGKDEKTPVQEKPPTVTLVVVKDRSRMAIVDGEVVKEGDRTKNGRIMRITKNGVLMKSKEGERWINIE